MLLSMAVLLVPILLISWFFTREPDEPPLENLDWKAAVATARAEADFPVMAPTEVPASWRATSTYWHKPGQQVGDRSLAGHEWSLGLLDDNQQHLSLKQSDAPAAAWLRAVMRDGREDGTVRVKDHTWTKWVSADGRTHYLSRAVGDSTVLLAADHDAEALVTFAGMLSEG